MSQSATREQLTENIRRHYDVLSEFYRFLWGPHIHHGYWKDSESPGQAQVKLIERLAARLEIEPGHRVLDIGSGPGGSACWLARTFGCSVLGLTLSAVQADAANRRALDERVSNLVRFQVHDANTLDLLPETFDRLWVIECSEHIHDKRAFFNSCARLLNSGGRLGLCVWLKGSRIGAEHEELVREICRAMLCPSLLTMEEQLSVLALAGFDRIGCEDITAHVLPTWSHCIRLAKDPLIRLILRRKLGRLRRFVNSFELMERGYREGAMAYGMITAAKGKADAPAFLADC
jgi:tocopherol O-methyltransferase